MDESPQMGKMLQELVFAVGNAVAEGQAEQSISRVIGDSFGIERVAIRSFDADGRSGLYEYLYNTKKTFIDNELSEYSSFPELIEFRSRGFRSCAAVPVVIGGRVVSIVEMLSTSENKFSQGTLDWIFFGAYMGVLALNYRRETEKSMRLAGYFSSAFSGADPQMLVSIDGRIIKSNDAALRLFPGRKSISDMMWIRPEQLPGLSKSGKSQEVQIKDGSTIKTYELSAGQASDKVFHMVLRDRTGMARLRALFNLMDAGSYAGALFLDDNLRITDASESIVHATGYDRNLLIGKGMLSLVPDRQRGELTELLQRQKGQRMVRGSLDLSTSLGTSAHLRFTMSGWENGYVMLFSDATAEGYAKTLESALTDFMASTSDMVIRMGLSGYVSDCNLPAAEMLGYQRSDLIGKDVRALYSDPSIFDRDIAYVRNGGKVDNSYATFITKGGATVETTHSIRLLSGTESKDYVIVAKELETKRMLQNLEDELSREKAKVSKLTSTGNLKSQFIYNISHELKTPLTNIIGFSKLMYKGEFGEMNPEQLSYLSTIMDETDRLLGIIQQVLDAAKLESQKMKLELREVDLAEMGNNPTIRSLREAAENKHLKFDWHVEYDVPRIMADPNKLMQVFVNLIGNAIKFTEKGFISVRIYSKSKKTIQCEVTDTGIGVSDEDRRKLFRKFYEAPKKGLVKQEGSGTGLGLSITKEIISLHGGTINCESESGRGSKFYFTLKVRPKQKKE